MRIVVLVLALLAAGKVVSQEYRYRTSLTDAVVAAYRDRAAHACFVDSMSLGLPLAAKAWSQPDGMHVSIGKSQRETSGSHLTNPFRSTYQPTPHLVLVPAGRPRHVSCEYDVVNDTAAVSDPS